MCGRYTLTAGHEALARAFLAEFAEELKASWKPRYNIAPGTGITAILEDRDTGGRKAEILHWGLVPHWAKDTNIGYKLINARSETIAAKPAFRDAFRYRRCLIPASGFYEWDRNASPRQPYYFYPENEEFMAMAGVWEYWLHPSGSEILSASIVTMAADKTVSGVHHRMPLILTPRAWDAWLDTGKVTPGMEEFVPLCIPDGYLARRAVSRAVNKTATDGEELIQPRDPRLEGGIQAELF